MLPSLTSMTAVFLAVVVSPSLLAATQSSVTLQDFEGAYQVTQWAEKQIPGKVALSSDWKSTGTQSLRLDAGWMTNITEFKTRDWSGHNTLRFSVRNTDNKPAQLNFELRDDQSIKYWDRHCDYLMVEPGEHTLEISLSDTMHRGEPTSPYRGEVKVPLNRKRVMMIAFMNRSPSAAMYIDSIELLNKPVLETPGGFAFDFSGERSRTMAQWIPVKPSTQYNPQNRFGSIAAGASTAEQEASWPTPLLGSGLSFPKEGFRMDLEGGDYIGWVAFERGGFWEHDRCFYTEAELQLNGTPVHQHEFDRAGVHFFFQDTEILSMDEVAEKLVWPAHQISNFKFKAAAGANIFTLATKNTSGKPLRIAGLIVAPDTDAGRAFIAAHEALQKSTLHQVFKPLDRGRRGEGRQAPETTLVCDVLPPGEMIYPRDWPSAVRNTLPPEILAISGQTVCLHFGLYAQKSGTINVAATSAAHGAQAAANVRPDISYGRYMPTRYQVGGAWLHLSHYWPAPSFTIGPDLSRSLIVEYRIPKDAAAGVYKSTITIDGIETAQKFSVSIKVIPVELKPLPIPVGLLVNALPMDPASVGEETWWKLQESVLREQIGAGLNALTGGPGLMYPYANGRLQPGNPVKYIRLAEKYGPILACCNYGGFFYDSAAKSDPRQFAEALNELEREHNLPPHFINYYDEPSTDALRMDLAAKLLTAKNAGLRTIGFSSADFETKSWVEMYKNTFAPALNQHDKDFFAAAKALGNHPWVYNQGSARYYSGLQLWRQIKLGAEGRLDWIGFHTQGFAFNDLDGREPTASQFLLHRDHGVLPTTSWLARREGLLDCRLRLTLEDLAPADDPVLNMWSTEGYRQDLASWTESRLEQYRAQMIRRIEELSGGRK
ncbi:MAG TPA: carbohydrate binding domain-containing protein [Planctomycetota bacterium]|nr:carbohydrate binding domain-containing protein [Planctomycetota bacterium]